MDAKIWRFNYHMLMLILLACQAMILPDIAGLNVLQLVAMVMTAIGAIAGNARRDDGSEGNR